MSIEARGFFYCAANEPLEQRTFSIESPGADEAVVEIAGCGLCHTDISFLSGQVGTRHELPLVLGHEISGRVVATGENFSSLMGKQVIVPAVLPCGKCTLCKAGRDNICQHQKMPGNDFNGGFATHLSVPARSLCELPDDLGKFELAELSVVADAITTPYQSLIRSRLRNGELAIVIGTGGIGLYMVQHAKAVGATVIALDLDPAKVAQATAQGADYGLCTADKSARDVKKQVRQLVGENQLPSFQWKIFETSGSAGGQTLAFSMLTFASTLGVIGFTMDKLNLRLSNVMAFDADLFGNWGCSPKHYPAVADAVLNGSINLRDNIELHPLDTINEVIALSLEHKLARRAILVP